MGIINTEKYIVKNILRKKSGFTLIELLVVIAVVGVLAGALVVLINPAAMLDRARIAKGKSFYGQLTRTLGFYNVGEWKFNEASNPAKDSSGNNNNGIVTGATHIPTCDLGLGGCYSFDGVDDYINVPGGWLNSSQTVLLWVKPLTDWSSAIGRPISSLRWSGPDHDGFFLNATSNSIGFTLYNNSQAEYGASIPIKGSSWSHFALTWTTTEIKFYIDGSLVNSTSKTNIFDFNTTNLNIGRYNYQSNNYFAGQIDEVYIFNQSLSQAMIQQIYSRGAARHFLASNNL